MAEETPAVAQATGDALSESGAVYVDGARVVTADIQASNGVIHVIDAVIMPAAATAGAGN